MHLATGCILHILHICFSTNIFSEFSKENYLTKLNSQFSYRCFTTVGFSPKFIPIIQCDEINDQEFIQILSSGSKILLTISLE